MARPLPCFVGFSIDRARSNPDPGALQSIDGAGALLGIAAPGARLCLARFQPLNNLGAGVERVRHGLDERAQGFRPLRLFADSRSEEHTSELQSLMRISYAVFC